MEDKDLQIYAKVVENQRNNALNEAAQLAVLLSKLTEENAKLKEKPKEEE